MKAKPGDDCGACSSSVICGEKQMKAKACALGPVA